jgi:hypothetical protein
VSPFRRSGCSAGSPEESQAITRTVGQRQHDWRWRGNAVSNKQVEPKIGKIAREEQTLTQEQTEQAQGGFSWGATQLGTSAVGTSADAGKVSMQDFHFVM